MTALNLSKDGEMPERDKLCPKNSVVGVAKEHFCVQA